MPSCTEMEDFYKLKAPRNIEFAFLDFAANNIYGEQATLAAAPEIPMLLAHTPTVTSPTVSEVSGSPAEQPTNQLAQSYGLDYSLQHAKEHSINDSHKKFDGKNAKNNDEFLDMFLNGSGNDRQEHSRRGDPILEQFIKSPGAQAVREQYVKLGCPSFTNKLGYGTKDAFVDTIAKPIGDSFTHGFKDLLDDKHLGNIGLQVGGFGNPPKDYPGATASATRCNADGKPNEKGGFVHYEITNVAGLNSWAYHVLPDRPQGSTGPYRSIVQVFSWMEALPSQTNGK
jgi:hypothetical protein